MPPKYVTEYKNVFGNVGTLVQRSNRLLMRLVGSKSKEATGDFGRLNNDGLHNLYLSPNIVIIIK
jgi:hypothetical protein